MKDTARMKTLDQLGAEVFKAVESALDGVPHEFGSAHIHRLPEELFTSGEIVEQDGRVYLRYICYPQEQGYPYIAFYSESRRPTEAERQAIEAQGEAERLEWERTKNTGQSTEQGNESEQPF